ncbi:NADPH:quinone reductase-like Zn-dependent oxidoreductase [Kibdelosporangium banguiense]|uniref:NADPH:quinone reductase-like Zn-dependent oxidoreductase n=1 Tax=Kibdelosporangium banguiense TaxID=1365924 RepID=A0ABS4TR65_9PSEU|nr:NADP-dependent oxidoreductase [Kibdelosporangium banguiense]MBP2326366.1 NADPH:quinone reductase-like Zn-dependent oxidoreductase [Kibdelosporangium banguiense]
MKAARIHRHGDPSVIQIDDVPIPVPGPGEVLVKVAATSFNPTEIAVRRGILGPMDLPYTLGWDVAGTANGEPVFGWLDGGAAADYVVAPRSRLVSPPSSIPLVTAAAIPLAGLTAWQAVIPNVAKGQRVFINGAGGGIGGFAVQLAKYVGAHVIATASPRSHETIRRYGADEIVDYTTGARLDDPVDVMIHLVGTPPPWIPPVGTIISAAAPVAAPPGVPSSHMVTQYDTGQLTSLAQLIDAGELVVDAVTHPLDDIAEVHRRGEAGDIRGKITITAAGDTLRLRG